MSNHRYLSRATLAVANAVVIAACSSDTPTTPEAASLLLTAAPTISLAFPIGFVRTGSNLCYPARHYSTRGGCFSSINLSISNTGGGTLHWTATKNAPWLKISPRSGAAPSAMKVRVDGTGVPHGSYSGQIKVSAVGATNSPQTVVVHFTNGGGPLH